MSLLGVARGFSCVGDSEFCSCSKLGLLPKEEVLASS